jgi:acid phosphatase
MEPQWSGDKSSRRSHVATTHRILQLLGDDLGDFMAAARVAGADGRSQLVEEERSRWGKSWFLVPNPMYGSWEKALPKQ